MALTFDYKVRDRTGKLVEGQLEGDSLALVVRQAPRDGLHARLRSRPKSGGQRAHGDQDPGFSNRVKLAEIAVVTRQLATMVDSGLSVVRSLGHPGRPGREQGAGPGPRRGAAGGRARLVAVGGVRQAPQDLQHTSSCTMVQAGEVGGNLDAVLLDLAATIEKQARAATARSGRP